MKEFQKLKNHMAIVVDEYGGVDGLVTLEDVIENYGEIAKHSIHAKSLGFFHPTLKKELNFDSELPDYFEEVLNKWRRY